MELVSQFINGVSKGGIYALIALGYTLVYGIAKLINLPTGTSSWSVRMLRCSRSPPWRQQAYPCGCVLPAIIVCVALGMVIERWRIDRCAILRGFRI